MKKEELKQILRPLIKECIKEVVFEEGFLSRIITETAIGLQTATPLVESSPPPTTRTRTKQPPLVDMKKQKEARRRVMEAVGSGAYNGVNLFEGTNPISKADQHRGPTQVSSDSGVDISDLINPNWGKLIK